LSLNIPSITWNGNQNRILACRDWKFKLPLAKSVEIPRTQDGFEGSYEIPVLRRISEERETK